MFLRQLVVPLLPFVVRNTSCGVMVKAGAPKPRLAKDPTEVNKEMKRKIAETTHLIDKQDIAEISSKKSKPSKASTTVDEKLISKILRDNFKGWGP